MNRVADPPVDGGAVDPLAVVATQSGGVGLATNVSLPRARRQRQVWVRLAAYVATVFFLITFNFALPRLMPGDPIDALMIQGQPNYVQNDKTRARLAEYYHLDGSLAEQYARYLKGLATADFGVSVQANRPVSSDLRAGLPWSLLLIVSSTIVGIVIGIPGGLHSGWKRGKRLDRWLLTIFMGWSNLPIFVLGTLALFILSVELQLFPYGGGVTPFADRGGFSALVDIARHLALPALSMGSLAATVNFLLMRSSLVSELGSDYLLLGRAKGLRQRRLKYRYAGRNALLPVATSIGLQIGLGFTAVIFIEQIFAYPGIGGYMFSAIGTRDYPALQGAFLLITMSVVTLNLLVDLLYRRLDPRTAT